ncbi:unnamed protein product, partial [Ilex paraguariensis]
RQQLGAYGSQHVNCILLLESRPHCTSAFSSPNSRDNGPPRFGHVSNPATTDVHFIESTSHRRLEYEQGPILSKVPVRTTNVGPH